ncbi:hypothetical protein B5S28_g1089 [[Candida] boidinii]|nr:hypothetical protein B5S28_g1089 [[Candida] boidinii]
MSNSKPIDSYRSIKLLKYLMSHNSPQELNSSDNIEKCFSCIPADFLHERIDEFIKLDQLIKIRHITWNLGGHREPNFTGESLENMEKLLFNIDSNENLETKISTENVSSDSQSAQTFKTENYSNDNQEKSHIDKLENGDSISDFENSTQSNREEEKIGEIPTIVVKNNEKASSRIKLDDCFDIYVLGFQEMIDLGKNISHSVTLINNWCAHIIGLLESVRDDNKNETAESTKGFHYEILSINPLLGLTTIIIVKSELKQYISNLENKRLATGRFGWKNKGGVSTTFNIGMDLRSKLGGVSLQLINCHLSAGETPEKIVERNMQLAKLQESFGLQVNDEENSGVRLASVLAIETDENPDDSDSESFARKGYYDDDDDETSQLSSIVDKDNMENIYAQPQITLTLSNSTPDAEDLKSASIENELQKLKLSKTLTGSNGGINAANTISPEGKTSRRNSAIQDDFVPVIDMDDPMLEAAANDGLPVDDILSMPITKGIIVASGDFNYRLKESDEISQLIKNTDIEGLLKLDQLKYEKQFSRIFNDFTEGSINFLPTYKFKVDPITGILDYDTLRRPSYTDRILYYTEYFKFIQKNYKSIHSSTTSDHKPVISDFNLTVDLPDLDIRDKIMREFLLYSDKLENHYQKLEIEIEPKFIDVDDLDILTETYVTIKMTNRGLENYQFEIIPILDEDPNDIAEIYTGSADVSNESDVNELTQFRVRDSRRTRILKRLGIKKRSPRDSLSNSNHSSTNPSPLGSTSTIDSIGVSANNNNNVSPQSSLFLKENNKIEVTPSYGSLKNGESISVDIMIVPFISDSNSTIKANLIVKSPVPMYETSAYFVAINATVNDSIFGKTLDDLYHNYRWIFTRQESDIAGGIKVVGSTSSMNQLKPWYIDDMIGYLTQNGSTAMFDRYLELYQTLGGDMNMAPLEGLEKLIVKDMNHGKKLDNQLIINVNKSSFEREMEGSSALATVLLVWLKSINKGLIAPRHIQRMLKISDKQWRKIYTGTSKDVRDISSDSNVVFIGRNIVFSLVRFIIFCETKFNISMDTLFRVFHGIILPDQIHVSYRRQCFDSIVSISK